MEIIQSSFQASFDARADRLTPTELAELRTIFRYFDTDNDGAVSADQACRMFALLGLDVNPAYVKELEEVYMNEFIKIVDSHVLLSSPAAPDPGAAGQGGDGSSAVGATVAGSLQATTPLIPVLQIVTPANLKTASDGDHPSEQLLVLNDPNASEEPSDGVVDKEDAIHRRNLQLWAHEWKLIDTFRSGSVGYEELRLFLRSCGSAIRPSDLMRFLEMYGDPAAESALQESANGEDTTFVLTKAGFLKFRHEYTKKEFAAESDRGLDSDYEGDDDAEDHIVKIQEHSARFETIQGMGSEKDSDGTNATNDDDKRRVVQHDGTVVQDQRVLDHSDESELDDEGDNGLE